MATPLADPHSPPSRLTSVPTILLVAPNGRVQDSLRILLIGLPLNVIGPVADARSALALAQAWQPPVAVIDYSLPAAEVADVLERFRGLSPAVRCLALVETIDQLSEAKAAKVEGLLLKGYRLDDLAAAIHQLLGEPPHSPPTSLAAGPNPLVLQRKDNA